MRTGDVDLERIDRRRRAAAVMQIELQRIAQADGDPLGWRSLGGVDRRNIDGGEFVLHALAAGPGVGPVNHNRRSARQWPAPPPGGPARQASAIAEGHTTTLTIRPIQGSFTASSARTLRTRRTQRARYGADLSSSGNLPRICSRLHLYRRHTLYRRRPTSLSRTLRSHNRRSLQSPSQFYSLPHSHERNRRSLCNHHRHNRGHSRLHHRSHLSPAEFQARVNRCLLCRRRRKWPSSRQRFLPHQARLGSSLWRLASTYPRPLQRTRRSQAPASRLPPTRARSCVCVFALRPASRVTLAKAFHWRPKSNPAESSQFHGGGCNVLRLSSFQRILRHENPRNRVAVAAGDLWAKARRSIMRR